MQIINHLELWKLATDVLLLMALGFMGYRILRSPMAAQSRQVMELEASLRVLMKEADLASRSLNEQLIRRQSSLQKLLLDLEGAEQRAARTLSSSVTTESLTNGAQREHPISTGRDMGQELLSRDLRKESGTRASTTTERSASGSLARSTPRSTALNIYGEEIGTALPTAEFDPPPPPRPTRSKSTNDQSELGRQIARSISQSLARENSTASEETKALGRQIAEAISKGMASDGADSSPNSNTTGPRSGGYRPLNQTVEKQIVPSLEKSEGTPLPETTSTGIEEVYAAAERLIRAGKDLDTVAARTNLSREDVQLISEMMNEQERSQRGSRSPALSESVGSSSSGEIDQPSPTNTTSGSADPRLGVLGGGIRRQVQVL